MTINSKVYQEQLYIHQQYDPDYIVDVLMLTSADIINAFPNRFRKYIEEEFGYYDGQDEEADYD